MGIKVLSERVGRLNQLWVKVLKDYMSHEAQRNLALPVRPAPGKQVCVLAPPLRPYWLLYGGLLPLLP